MHQKKYLLNISKLLANSFFECNNVAKFSSKAVQSHQKQLMEKGLPKRKPIEGVKNIVLISSGKGGVGKSTVAVNLATSLKLNHPDKKIGLLDTDIFGPTIPLMMNLHESPFVTQRNLMEPLVNYGVKWHLIFNILIGFLWIQLYLFHNMSFGFLIDEGAPVIWRGLMVMQALEKLTRQVDWQEIDYLIVDTPPGTGDTHLSLVQNLPISGVILVTTPHTASLQVTKRGARMYSILKVPIIGLAENMSSVKCPSCFNQIQVFGNGTRKLAEELQIEMLESFPISAARDEDIPIALDEKSDHSILYKSLAKKVVQYLRREDNKDEI